MGWKNLFRKNLQDEDEDEVEVSRVVESEKWRKKLKVKLRRENASARKVMGLTVRAFDTSNPRSPALFDSVDGRKMVVVHTTNAQLGRKVWGGDGGETEGEEGPRREVPGLWRAFSPTWPELSFLFTTGKANLDVVEAHIEKLQVDCNENQRAFLGDIFKWIKGNGGTESRQRYLCISGPKLAIEQGLGLGGHTVKYPQAGSVLKSVGRRSALDVSAVEPDADTGRVYHEAYGLPDDSPLFLSDVYYFGKRVFGVWKAKRLTAAALKKLMRWNADFCFRIRFLDPDSESPKMYLALLIRIETTAKNVGWLDYVDAEFGNIQGVKISRVLSTKAHPRDMEIASECFWPGGRKIPARWDMHSVAASEVDGILQIMAENITTVGDSDGNLVLGKQTGIQLGQPYRVNDYNHPVAVLVGPPKLGKSAWMAILASLLGGPLIFWINQKFTKLDAVFYWVKLFGGIVYPIEFADAKELAMADRRAGRTAPDPSKNPDAILAMQMELHEKDEVFAGQVWDWIISESLARGRVIGPLTFASVGKENVGKGTLRTLNFYRAFMEKGLEAYGELYYMSGKNAVMCVDNLSAMWKLASFRGIHADTANQFGDVLEDFMGNAANFGWRTLVNTHSASDLDRISVGVLDKVHVLYKMSRDDYETTDVFISREEIQKLVLGFKLSKELLEVVGRREPDQKTELTVKPVLA